MFDSCVFHISCRVRVRGRFNRIAYFRIGQDASDELLWGHHARDLSLSNDHVNQTSVGIRIVGFE